MSSSNALAAVSGTLRRLLLKAMDDKVPITITSPAVPVGDVSGRRLNIYLYHVGRNAFLANRDVSPQAHPASYGRPALSLDLHYLLTAYGDSDEDSLAAHRILGDAMRALHDNAILHPGDANVEDVLDDDLQQMPEALRITLEPLGVDQASSVWQALATTHRLSASYMISVVLLNSQLARRFPRLVAAPRFEKGVQTAGPRVVVAPLVRPRITAVAVRRRDRPATDPPSPSPWVQAGDTLVVTGSGFGANGLEVWLGDVRVTGAVVSDAGNRITVSVPRNAGLEPGPRTVYVSAPFAPDLPRGKRGKPLQFCSNHAGLVVVPTIVDARLDNGALVIEGDMLASSQEETQVLLGETAVPAGNVTSPAKGALRIRLPGKGTSGPTTVRVRVGGAECLTPREVDLP
ncbi:MAG: Pvc16 family protein [bacterium]